MAVELAQIVFKSTVFCLMASALNAGCSKTVVLGSECPAQQGPCGHDTTILPRPDPVSGEAGVVGGAFPGGDGGVFPTKDAEVSDGSEIQIDAGRVPIDAGQLTDPSNGQTTDAAQSAADAGPSDASSGLLQNPSFELRENPEFGVIENQFGSDVLVSDLAGYVPRAGEFFANIDPWFACWVGAQVESDLGGPAGGLEATEGGALITTGYGPLIWLPGLFQILEAGPLAAGRSYSFMLDVINSGNGRSALWLGATNLPCTMPEVYAATPELTNHNSWETHCLTFRTKRALSTFALMPVDVADGGVGQISFDNLRQVESCPP
jgi:hypothetical protein